MTTRTVLAFEHDLTEVLTAKAKEFEDKLATAFGPDFLDDIAQRRFTQILTAEEFDKFDEILSDVLEIPSAKQATSGQALDTRRAYLVPIVYALTELVPELGKIIDRYKLEAKSPRGEPFDYRSYAEALINSKKKGNPRLYEKFYQRLREEVEKTEAQPWMEGVESESMPGEWDPVDAEADVRGVVNEGLQYYIEMPEAQRKWLEFAEKHIEKAFGQGRSARQVVTGLEEMLAAFQRSIPNTVYEQSKRSKLLKKLRRLAEQRYRVGDQIRHGRFYGIVLRLGGKKDGRQIYEVLLVGPPQDQPGVELGKTTGWQVPVFAEGIQPYSFKPTVDEQAIIDDWRKWADRQAGHVMPRQPICRNYDYTGNYLDRVKKLRKKKRKSKASLKRNANIEKKKPFILPRLRKLYPEKTEPELNRIVEWLALADPISAKTQGAKTPFVNKILEMLAEGVVSLEVAPELIRVQFEKENTTRDYGQLPLVAEANGFKMYRLDQWDSCLDDSGWCIKTKEQFDSEVRPPVYLIARPDNKRFALFDDKSGQLKDVYNKSLNPEDAKRILPLIETIFPLSLEDPEAYYDEETGEAKYDLLRLLPLKYGEQELEAFVKEDKWLAKLLKTLYSERSASVLTRRLRVIAGRLKKKAVKEYFDEQEIMELLSDGLPDLKIEQMPGEERDFSGTEKKELPFAYGEIPNYINSADDMGWDVIILPSTWGCTRDELMPVGILRYNRDVNYWNTLPGDDPIGNDKILLGKRSKDSTGDPRGEYTKEDLDVLHEHFKDTEAFESPELIWDYV